jgi:hypothetical protein
MFGLRLIVACVVCCSIATLDYIEQRQWWTLRLSVSRLINGWVLVAATLVGTAHLVHDIVSVYDDESLPTRLTLGSLVVASSFLLLHFLLPLAHNSDYTALRWKAWTGPSRTGISPSLIRYLGDAQDWRSLASLRQSIEVHPVETSLTWVSAFTGRIPYDPTDLLMARLRTDDESDMAWIPRSQSKVGVYEPVDASHHASLLWGEEAGFMRRCSRGIIAVPKSLLTSYPKLKNGVDGRPLCIAHGILARNKGLEPWRLICNLQSPSRLQPFEENSSLWPRPAKTLRSYYRAELSKAFSGLGPSFVCAATELALLLADAKPVVVMDWLDNNMEHQDLSLNQSAARLGASADELNQLYRGQYVAMLVSLSEHRIGMTLRPELTVFKAVRALEGNRDFPDWLNESSMKARLEEEQRLLGARCTRLVAAAV